MRKLVVLLGLIAGCCGCHNLRQLEVTVTLSPTLHLDGLGRGGELRLDVRK